MKAYYNQEKISSSLRKFFNKISSISKPHLKLISYIITGMISAESVVTSDISTKLKDDFSLVHIESIERRFRRFFNSFAYSFYDSFIFSICICQVKNTNLFSLFLIVILTVLFLLLILEILSLLNTIPKS